MNNGEMELERELRQLPRLVADDLQGWNFGPDLRARVLQRLAAEDDTPPIAGGGAGTGRTAQWRRWQPWMGAVAAVAAVATIAVMSGGDPLQGILAPGGRNAAGGATASQSAAPQPWAYRAEMAPSGDAVRAVPEVAARGVPGTAPDAMAMDKSAGPRATAAPSLAAPAAGQNPDASPAAPPPSPMASSAPLPAPAPLPAQTAPVLPAPSPAPAAPAAAAAAAPDGPGRAGASATVAADPPAAAGGGLSMAVAATDLPAGPLLLSFAPVSPQAELRFAAGGAVQLRLQVRNVASESMTGPFTIATYVQRHGEDEPRPIQANFAPQTGFIPETLVPGAVRTWTLTWNGRWPDGSTVAPGTYTLRVQMSMGNHWLEGAVDIDLAQ